MKKTNKAQNSLQQDDLVILKWLAEDYMCKDIAEFLEMSASSVSHRISRISKAYGFDIIERKVDNKRRIKLTVKGKKLANKARKSIQAWEN